MSPRSSHRPWHREWWRRRTTGTLSRPYIVVTGSEGGFGNLGDEFLLESTLRFYRDYLDRFNVVVAMINPPERADDGFIYVGEDSRAFDALEIDPSRIALLHYYGGGYFNEYWYEAKIGLYRHLISQGLPRNRVAFTGLGLGPFKGSQAEELAGIARESLVFGTRDRSVVDGVGGDFTFDESIALYSPSMTRHRGDNSRTVAFNFRTGTYIGLDDEGAQALVRSVDRFLEAGGLDAIAFGMVKNPRFDESVAIERGIEASGSPRIRSLARPTGFAELAERLAACRATITTSYHVALVSLYVGTPVVALFTSEYYRLKFTGLAEAVDTPLLRLAGMDESVGGPVDDVVAAASVDENVDNLRATLESLKRVNQDSRDIIARTLEGAF